MDKEDKNLQRNKSVAGLLIPGGLLLGMGVGFLVGNIPAGLFVGLGAGFVFFVLILLVKK